MSSDLEADLAAACADIRQMRDLLLRGLGVATEEQHKLADTFTLISGPEL